MTALNRGPSREVPSPHVIEFTLNGQPGLSGPCVHFSISRSGIFYPGLLVMGGSL